MSEVLDYSAGFPGAQAIKDAGYPGAVRYIGFPDRRKCATASELRDFNRHGIGMALVFEDDAADWRGGRPAGRRAATLGRAHATAIGFPLGRPVYLAIDQDVVNTGEFETMLDYLRGANEVIGAALTGVYGEADVIDRARDAGVASWFWQTAAWSRGRVAGGLHLYQHVGTVRVGGVDCDENAVIQQDWGQHNGGDMATAQEIAAAVMTELYNARFEGNRNIFDMGVENVRQSFAIRGGVAALGDDEAHILAALAGGNGDILRAVAGIVPSAPTDEQMATLARAFRTGLGEEMAGVFGRLLQAEDRPV